MRKKEELQKQEKGTACYQNTARNKIFAHFLTLLTFLIRKVYEKRKTDMQENKKQRYAFPG